VYKAATRAADLTGLIAGICLRESHKALAGRKCILHSNRSLRARVPPALGFTHEEPALSIDFLLAHRQFKKLISPVCGLRDFGFVESLHHAILEKRTSGIVSSTEGSLAPESLLVQKCVELGYDLKGICNVEDVGFATRPSAVWIEVNRAPFIDEAPSDHVWFFAMATG